MTPYRIITGSVPGALASIADMSIACCVTSPPYWGLRDYGHADQIRLERTPEEYVTRLVKVFREVRRVLVDDGTLWLNLGDSYASSTSGQSTGENMRLSTLGGGKETGERAHADTARVDRLVGSGLKPKDLVGIPWRVAFALQADGWWLRSDIIWHKPNPMPESVTDRPTKSHEYLFLLSKSESYRYDAEAIAESAICSGRLVRATGGAAKNASGASENADRRTAVGFTVHDTTVRETRNARTVWTIPTRSFPEAHFAVMPEELARRCVVAGAPPGSTVLDPFSGAATVGVAATKNGRHYIGCEINPEYVAMSERRLAIECPGLLFTGTEARP